MKTKENTEEKAKGGVLRKTVLTTRCLCEGAIFIALAQVLSYLKIYEMPQGGSVTVGMFPIVFFAFRWGLKSGLMASFTYGLLQLVFDGAYAWGWQSVIMDYLLAFTPLGLAGMLTNTKIGNKLGMVAMYFSTSVACFGRFAIHYLAGITVWAEYMPEEFTNVYYYSLVYNGSYMLPSSALVLIVVAFTHVPMQKYYLGQDIRKN